MPSTRGFSAAVRRELGDLSGVGSAAGAQASEGFSSSFGTGIRKAALAAGVGIAAAGTAAAAFGLKVAADNEQAQISFETMLGSAEKAGAFLTQLRNFAATTPFEFPELQTAASSLISVGISADKVIPIMTSLGNATSGMGTGAEGVKRATVALQQMNAAGRITAEDLNQLRDAGIPVFELLTAATGKSKEELAGMAQNGKLGRQELEQLMRALETGKGLERFNGLMDKQSQSLTGLISTLKDVAGQGLAAAMQPAVGAIKSALPAINQSLVPLLASLGKLASAAVLKPVLDIALRLAPPLTKIVDLLAEGLLGVFQELVPVIGEILDALAPVVTVFAEMAREVGPPLARALANVLRALLPLIRPLLRLAVILIERIGIPVLVMLAESTAKVAEGLAAIGDAVGTVLSSGIDALAGWFERLGTDPGAAWQAILAFFAQLPAKVVTAIGALGAWIWDHALKPAADYLATQLPGWLDAIAAFFRDLPAKVAAAIGSFGEWLDRSVFTPARNVVVANMPGWADAIAGAVQDLPAKMAGAIEAEKRLGAALWEKLFVPASDYLVRNAPIWLDQVAKAFRTLPEKIKTAMEATKTFGLYLWDEMFLPAAVYLAQRYPEWSATITRTFAKFPADVVRGITSLVNFGDMLWNEIFVPAIRTLVGLAPTFGLLVVSAIINSLRTLITQWMPSVVEAAAAAWRNLPGLILAILWNLGALLYNTIFLPIFSSLTAAIGPLVDSLAQLWLRLPKGALSILLGFGRMLWDDAILPAFTALFAWTVGKLDEFVDLFQALPARIASAAKGLWDGLVDAFIAALNQIIYQWNAFHLEIGGEVLGRQIGPFTLDTPDITPIKRARGGLVLGGQPAIVGEAGPELWWPRTAGHIYPVAAPISVGPAETTALRIDHLEVRGADQPQETAYRLRSELRWIGLVSRGT